MKSKLISIFFVMLLAALLYLIVNTGIFKQPKTFGPNTKKLQVTASFYPSYFFSSAVGLDKANVINLTPAGIEPHDFDPSIQDITRIENGRMLVLHGGIETWADKVKNNLKGKNVKIVTAGEGLFTKDPHTWLDPQLAKQEAQKITSGYIEIDPANTAYYQDNYKKLGSKLDNLDNQFRNGLGNCKRKDFITSHAAFAYLAEAYGLRQVSILGLSPDEEPSAQQLADVANFAKQNNIKYIFFESLVSPKLAQTLASEIGAKTLVLDPVEGLSDKNIKMGKDYFTLMQDNLKNLQISLECNQ